MDPTRALQSTCSREVVIARRYTERKLFLYAIHAHVAGTALDDYHRFFERIAEQSVRQRSEQTTDRILALRRVVVENSMVRLTIYEGPIGISPLIFDLATNEERIERLSTREVVATRTHVVFDLPTRLAVVEYNHRGAKAPDVARLLQISGRRMSAYRKLDVELAPVPSPDFARAVNEFDVIKIASLNLVRPNLNWNREKRHADAIAEESDAQRVVVSVYAGRGESLAKRRGLVRLIKTLGREPRPSVRDASVTGRRPAEQADTKVSLSRHLEHRVARVQLGPGGHPTTESVEAHIDEFLRGEARRRQRHRRREEND